MGYPRVTIHSHVGGSVDRHQIAAGAGLVLGAGWIIRAAEKSRWWKRMDRWRKRMSRWWKRMDR